LDARQDEIRFLVKLARGLHMYGTPADRIEQALEIATRRLGIPSRFFSLPTVILASFGDPELRSTGLIRVEPGSVHLEKLVLLDDVMKELLRGELTPEQAAARADAIETAPQRWGGGAQLAANALASGCAALAFGGGAREFGLAAALGAVTGALGLIGLLRPAYLRVHEAAAAFAVSFLALLLSSWVGGVSSYVLTVGALVVLLPGLSLTMAITELASQSLVSGTVRFVAALVVLLELIVGVALGRALAGLMVHGAPHLVAERQPAWMVAVALLGASAAFTVLFRARPRDMAPILAVGALGVLAARLGSAKLGPELGGFAGAFVVGVSSNLYARWRDRPVALAAMPALLLLVPGSVGFRGLTLLLEHEVVSGVEAAFGMLLAAASLVAGFLFANVAVPSRRAY
jgi:uncharacterized membrane protein YjjP (DUF1212 family)